MRQLLVFDRLDRVNAPILETIAERLEDDRRRNLLGVRLGFDKPVAPHLANNPKWRAAHQRLLRSVLQHVAVNAGLLGLELQKVPLTPYYTRELGAALRGVSGDSTSPRKLQFLRMSGCQLSRASVAALMPALAACEDLRLLDLSGCKLGADSMPSIVELLKAHGRRTAALQAKGEARAWEVSLRNDGEDEAEAEAEPQKELVIGLHTLQLARNDIGDEGARALARALRWVRVLDVRENGIGAAGREALLHMQSGPFQVPTQLLIEAESDDTAANAAARAAAAAAHLEEGQEWKLLEDGASAAGAGDAKATRREGKAAGQGARGGAATRRKKPAKPAAPLAPPPPTAHEAAVLHTRRSRSQKFEDVAKDMEAQLRALGAVGGPARKRLSPEAWAELVRACGGPAALLDGIELLLERRLNRAQPILQERIAQREDDALMAAETSAA